MSEPCDLSARTPLQLAYIAQVYPDADVKRRCEELLARAGVHGRRRRWLDFCAQCAQPWIALCHGGDEDLDAGCFAAGARELRFGSGLGLLVLLACWAVVAAALFWASEGWVRIGALAALGLFLWARARRSRV